MSRLARIIVPGVAERLEKLFDLYTKMTASAAAKPARKAKA
jgi:hypothetical protein